jgi:hypothetical protein
MRITTPFVSTANPLGAVLAWLATGLLSVATLVLCPYNGAEAHGIAGNRLFLGTLTFDDPAVNDEFSSAFSDLRRSAPEGAAVDRALSVGLSRLLTLAAIRMRARRRNEHSRHCRHPGRTGQAVRRSHC